MLLLQPLTLRTLLLHATLRLSTALNTGICTRARTKRVKAQNLSREIADRSSI